MSEWLNFVKSYAATHNIPYKQALKDASPSYKTRNEIPQKVIQPEITPDIPEIKSKKKYIKKVVEKISVKLKDNCVKILKQTILKILPAKVLQPLHFGQFYHNPLHS